MLSPGKHFSEPLTLEHARGGRFDVLVGGGGVLQGLVDRAEARIQSLGGLVPLGDDALKRGGRSPTPRALQIAQLGVQSSNLGCR